MEDWRSAVDEKSGRTYWYHRKTRESTWTRPACFDTPDAEADSSAPSSKNKIKKNRLDGGELHLLELLQDLGPPETLVSLLFDSSEQVQAEAVQLLLACTLPDTMPHLSQEPSCVEGLIRILLSASTSRSTRRSSLRILCSFASDERSSSCFLSCQGWTSLAARFTKWDDLESAIMFVLLLCLLLKGVARKLITQEMLHQATMWICKLSSCLDGSPEQPELEVEALTHHPSGKGTSLFDACLLLQLTCRTINQTASGLPGMLLLVMMRVAWQDPVSKHQVIRSGGLLALQMLLTQLSSPEVLPDDPSTAEAILSEAQALLLDAMACSDFARQHVLRSWSDLASSACRLSEAQGRDPLCARSFLKSQASRSTKAYMDVELRPRGHGTAWRLSSALLHARCPGMRDMLEEFWAGSSGSESGGGLEVSVDCTERVLAAIVHYLHSGLLLPVQLTSMPALASTLVREHRQETTNSDGELPDMEDASSATLELCRIASELGIAHLEQLASESFVQLCFDCFFSTNTRGSDEYDSPEDLELAKVLFMKRVLRLSEKWSLDGLQQGLSYLMHNGYCEHTSQLTPMPLESEETSTLTRDHNQDQAREKAAGEQAWGELHLEMEEGDAASSQQTQCQLSPGSLHRAVLTSLDDVESILQEPTLRESDAVPSSRKHSGARREQSSSVESLPQSHQPKKHGKKPQYPRSKAGGKKKEAERRDGMQTGGHGDIYRVLLEESGKGDFAELDDTPEYVPVPGSKEEIFVPKERGKQSTIVSMGMEIEEYMPTKHSIKPPESSLTKKNKKAMQEKRSEEMSVPKHMRKKPEKKRPGSHSEVESLRDSTEDLTSIASSNSAGKTVKKKASEGQAEESPVSRRTKLSSKASNSRSQPHQPHESHERPDQSGGVGESAGPGGSQSSESPGSVRKSLTLLKKKSSAGRGRRGLRTQHTSDHTRDSAHDSTSNLDSVADSTSSSANVSGDGYHGVSTNESTTGNISGSNSATPADQLDAHHHLENQHQRPPLETPQQDASGQYPHLPSELDDTIPTTFQECPSCHRKFNPQSFEKHRNICSKVFMQKRKAFDSKKMRRQDNPDLAEAVKVSRQASKAKKASHQNQSSASTKTPKWKADSEAFRAAMRAGKATGRAMATGGPLPEVVSTPDPSLVPCPTCGRTFNEMAAERHIPHCKQSKSRPTALRKGSGSAGGKGPANRRATIV